MTYICRGHGIQFLLVARVPALDRVQVQRCRSMDPPPAARMEPRLPAQRATKLVLLFLQSLPRLLIPLLLARFVLQLGSIGGINIRVYEIGFWIVSI